MTDKPCKYKIEKISKEIPDRITSLLCSNLKVSKCSNTSSVIIQFRNNEDKQLYKFLRFDIKDFYPSIKGSLFHKALQSAKMRVNITQRNIEVIFHSRKSLLCNNRIPWIKKQGNGFDITIGAYDGAETCELTGIFMFSLIEKKCDFENIGLYSDDVLRIFRNASGPKLEKLKKHIQKISKEKMLEVIIKYNMKIVNYLDKMIAHTNLMPNLKSLMNNHNQNILKDQPPKYPNSCNCLRKGDCPMGSLCHTESLQY